MQKNREAEFIAGQKIIIFIEAKAIEETGREWNLKREIELEIGKVISLTRAERKLCREPEMESRIQLGKISTTNT